MLRAISLALLVACHSSPGHGDGAMAGAEDELLLLRGYDRLAVVSVADPSHLVQEWNLAGAIRDISSVASSKDFFAVLARTPGVENPCLFVLSRSGSAVARLKCGRILAIALDPSSETCFLLERTAGHARTVQIFAVDPRERPFRIAAYSAPVELGATSFSVANGGERIVFESAGYLFDFDQLSGNLGRLTEGTAPSLSPDGSKLAFLRDGDLYVYDYEAHLVQRILSRRFWQARLLSPISWSLGGRSLSVAVPAGLTGKQLGCLVVRETGDVEKSFATGSRWCGPWVRKLP